MTTGHGPRGPEYTVEVKCAYVVGPKGKHCGAVRWCKPQDAFQVKYCDEHTRAVEARARQSPPRSQGEGAGRRQAEAQGEARRQESHGAQSPEDVGVHSRRRCRRAGGPGGGGVNLTSQLYRAARLSATVSAVASGKPRRVARRAKNIVVGRALARAGVWRRLWR
jgi:hypothetical protein